MKINIIIIISFLSVSGLFAQKGKVNVALNYKESGNLDKAVAAIEEAVDPRNPKAEKSVNWPRVWEVRGEIYQAIYKSKDGNHKKLHADPLTEAYKSYMKSIELDNAKRFSSSILIKLQLLIADLSNQAEKAFKEKNYNKALESFEQILAIENTPVYRDGSSSALDTVVIYNTGLVAFNARKYDKAITYFKQAVKYQYNGSKTYDFLVSSYLCKADTAEALNFLQEGLKAYPADVSLLSQMINLYQKKNRPNEAMKFLDTALSEEPGNEFFHFAQGYLYEQMKNSEEAIQCYQKAIDLKPEYTEAYVNLGLVYYNQGVTQLDAANTVPGNQPEIYESEKNKADLEFRKALPYLEKSYQLNSSDKMILELLKNVYYRLQMLDKHNAIVKILKDE
ncbi:MAG: tetratricopeptide repeat protein [Mangrovibacterium sp.]